MTFHLPSFLRRVRRRLCQPIPVPALPAGGAGNRHRRISSGRRADDPRGARPGGCRRSPGRSPRQGGRERHRRRTAASALSEPHMASAEGLYIQIAHQVPERTRLRLAPAPVDAVLAEQLANVLVTVPGMKEVQINRRTGSVLCRHQDGIDAGKILALLQETSRAAILQPGEKPPAPAPVVGSSAVGRALANAFRSMNTQLLTVTRGSLDLGTVAAFGFMGAGALEVATTGKLPVPPWFNLAWWSFRTFMTFETGPRADSPAPPTQGATS